MRTLGEKLAINQALKNSQDTAYLKAQAAAQEEENLRKFKLVQDFFDQAKVTITAAIEKGETGVAIQTGLTHSNVANMEVHTLLRAGCSGNDLAALLSFKTHPYFCLWRDFTGWGASEGLVLKFDYRWDGGGMHSWDVLICTPVHKNLTVR
jgi:hypothetical protein